MGNFVENLFVSRAYTPWHATCSSNNNERAFFLDENNMQNSKTHIAVVEDDSQMRTLLADFLTNQGYLVSCFSSGFDAATNLYSKNSSLSMVSAVVSDIAMPGVDGMELLKMYQKEKPELPFILITAYGSQEGAEKAKYLGAADYLIKPFKLGDLQSAIECSIEKQRQAVPQSLSHFSDK